MKILMTGLNHKNSELSIREKFALTKEKSKNIIKAYMDLPFVEGCVIIFTCNRTEVYIAANDSLQFDITEFLCRTLELDPGEYASHFIQRDEKDAFCHLCKVASGINSQIPGDDQIITQVREAAELSRENNFTNSYIEKMFITAITAAKEIKTNVDMRSKQAASAPHRAVEKIKSFISPAGKKAVVIGNGQMGRLAAELLLKESAEVTVTLREYKKGIVQIPRGAKTIEYNNRYEAVKTADIAVSATTSPHYTLRCEDFIKLGHIPEIIVDLAVPRDIDPAIGKLPGVNLFTIDDLGSDDFLIPQEKIILADQIIEKNMQNYYKWLEYKEKIKCR